MTRVIVLVEGPTEENFVNDVLSFYLYDKGFTSISASLLGGAYERKNRGGIRRWESARNDIMKHLKSDRGILVTTMIDYYGLPDTEPGAWPGRERAGLLPFHQQAVAVEDAVLSDIRSTLGEEFYPAHFIPNVTMHEFEALLFSDCVRFGDRIGHPELIPHLQAIRDQFGSPEEINDSFDTAPSKRVEGIFPEYKKPLDGVQVAGYIGIATIRDACPHFSNWIERLESWLTRSQ